MIYVIRNSNLFAAEKFLIELRAAFILLSGVMSDSGCAVLFCAILTVFRFVASNAPNAYINNKSTAKPND